MTRSSPSTAPNRSLAEADLGDDTDPELKKLRRHEAMLHSRLRWFTSSSASSCPKKSLIVASGQAWIGDHEAAPDIAVVAAPPLPEPKAVVSEVEYVTPGVRFPMPHPPFDLEPNEYPMAGNIPRSWQTDGTRTLKKAEAVGEHPTPKSREAPRPDLQGLRDRSVNVEVLARVGVDGRSMLRSRFN